MKNIVHFHFYFIYLRLQSRDAQMVKLVDTLL